MSGFRFAAIPLSIYMIAASAAVAAIDRAIDFIDLFVRFVFTSTNPSPALALPDEPEGFGGFIHPFSGLIVDRHEAGQSRRAAARGI